MVDCLADYTAAENLDGENKYFCSHCNSKQDAKRQVTFSKLPPFLYIQLLRFQFSMESLGKVKLKDNIFIPEALDMSPYVSPSSSTGESQKKSTASQPGGCWYDLYAVLRHKGTSAERGHYVCDIRSTCNGHWYHFNDTEVSKLGSHFYSSQNKRGTETKSRKKTKGKTGKRGRKRSIKVEKQEQREGEEGVEVEEGIDRQGEERRRSFTPKKAKIKKAKAAKDSVTSKAQTEASQESTNKMLLFEKTALEEEGRKQETGQGGRSKKKQKEALDDDLPGLFSLPL